MNNFTVMNILDLMESVGTNDVIKDIQRRSGGGIIYLDCEDKQKLKDFYIDGNHYKLFGERYSNSDGIRYLQMIRFF